MTFVESISTCLKKYATFEGRASRSEYWWFFLFTLLVQFGSSVISNIPSLLWALALRLPSIAVGARRLHDIGKSGWWLLISLIPLIGVLILIYWLVPPGAAGRNHMGDPAPQRAWGGR